MSQIPPEQRQMLDGRYVRRGDFLILNVNTTNISNPPGAAELDAIFGNASDLPDGFTAIINDNGLGLVYWLVSTVGSTWLYEQWTIAV
jgi:hypothetical protein